MKDILVIGAGPAAITFLNKIIERSVQAKITLVNKNPYSFNKTELLSTLSCKKELELDSWAKSHGIEFICDSVDRINIRRRKVYFKKEAARAFDTLVIASGAKSRKIEVKGEHREGFFYLSDMDPIELRALLRISPEATVGVSTILGIKLALALASLEKEVRIVAKDLEFLGSSKERCLNFLGEKNISVHLEASIEEAIGEGAVRAAKIQPLKVFSSQLVFIDSGFDSNKGFFEEELTIRDTFFTNTDGVYLLGDVTRPDLENERFFPFNYQEAVAQGQLLADFILERKQPVFERKPVGEAQKQQVIEDILGQNTAAESL